MDLSILVGSFVVTTSETTVFLCFKDSIILEAARFTALVRLLIKSYGASLINALLVRQKNSTE